MALYPKIQSPCPYKGRIEDILDGEVCRLCRREVHDLTAMSDSERVAFMKSCTGEICVRYSVRPAIAAAALAATLVTPTAAAACSTVQMEIVMVGGIKKPAEVQYVRLGEEAHDRTMQQIPVVYDEPAPQKAADTHSDAPVAPPPNRPAAP